MTGEQILTDSISSPEQLITASHADGRIHGRGSVRARYIPKVSPHWDEKYVWSDETGDNTDFRCKFSVRENDYICVMERIKIHDDISDFIYNKLGIYAKNSVFFLKFDNSANQMLDSDFARIRGKQVAIGAASLTRLGLDQLFSHLTHASLQFMSWVGAEGVFAVGNDQKLHEFYRRAFLGNSFAHLGFGVDELDLRAVQCVCESVLALRRL